MMESIQGWFSQLGFGEARGELLSRVTALLGVAVLAFLANLAAKKIIMRVVRHVARRTKTDWDDILVEKRVFSRFSHLAPALVIWTLVPQVLGEASDLATLARRGAEIYMLVVGLLIASAFLDAVNEIYQRFSMALRMPIRGYLQVIKIVLSIAVGIFALSITLDKSPWIFLSGLGAMTAVLLLIFKDSILGLVAGIQLSANDMVRPGDWIEMLKYGADGDVMEVTLTTVKVRNWDKTITTIPTYALITDSFRNWRGMTMSGGRRIKRSVWIDVNSIRFCTPEMIERFERIELLRDYVQQKRRELERYNRERGVDDSSLANGRRMTNIGTFRAYLVQYLRQHPKLHQQLTMLVRQLQPTEKGLPIEVYVFSSDQRWVEYEGIQADIFDHILAALPEFGLRPFQLPTGADIAGALGGRSAATR